MRAEKDRLQPPLSAPLHRQHRNDQHQHHQPTFSLVEASEKTSYSRAGCSSLSLLFIVITIIIVIIIYFLLIIELISIISGLECKVVG